MKAKAKIVKGAREYLLEKLLTTPRLDFEVHEGVVVLTQKEILDKDIDFSYSNTMKEWHIEMCLTKHLSGFDKWLRKHLYFNKWVNKYIIWKYNISMLAFEGDILKYGVEIKGYKYITHIPRH